MRLSKFLAISFFVTMFLLLYIYQQAEIFRLAYAGQKKRVAFQELLDQNKLLRYNVGKTTSLVHLGSRISGNSDFQMPDTYRLVRLTQDPGSLTKENNPPQKENLFVRIFGIKREAQAKTINP